MWLAWLFAWLPGHGCPRLFRSAGVRRPGRRRGFSHGPRFRALALPADHRFLEALHAGRSGLNAEPRQSDQVVHRLGDEIAGAFAPVGLAASLSAVLVHVGALWFGHLNALVPVTPRVVPSSLWEALACPKPGTLVEMSGLRLLAPSGAERMRLA